MARARSRSRHRGISLVEALVALAVMAFGMLALVGVQATMRLNSDVAKQRSEATRIATEEIERLRGFRAMAVVTGQPGISYDEITSRTATYAAPDATIGNATYSITRTVIAATGTQQKTVAVRVGWTDRSGQAQSVTLESVISGTDPALSGLLAVPPVPSAVHQRGGRHPTIPPEAVDFPSLGRSGFKPFGLGTVYWLFNNSTGDIVGVCTNAANAPPSVSDSCDPITALLLSGEVSFNFRLYTTALDDPSVVVLRPVSGSTAVLKINTSTQQIVNGRCTLPIGSTSVSDLSCVGDDANPGRTITPFQVPCASPPCSPDPATNLIAEDSEQPQWPALNLSVVRVGTGDTTIDTVQFNQSREPTCVTDAPASLDESISRQRRTVRYYCIIYPNSGGWGGRFDLQPVAFPDTGGLAWNTGTGGLKVCRYTQASSQFTVNRDHPATYCVERSGTPTSAVPCTGQRVTRNLINQNFLVIGGNQTCPVDGPVDPATGNLINSNTLQHQP